MMVRVRPALAGAVVLVAILGTLEATEKIQSLWSEGGFSVDGQPVDWNGKGRMLKDEDMMFGVSNDNENLYVAMYISEQKKLAQVFSRGMTLWFDPNGGKKRSFGVRFPLSRRPGGARQRGGSGSTARRERSGGGAGVQTPPESGSGPANAEQPRTVNDMVAAMRELEIVGPDKDDLHRAPLEDVQDVVLRASWQGQGLFYELKIPLARNEDHPFGIGVRPDKPLGIGIETPRVERAPTIGGMTGSTRSGGRGGGTGSSGVPTSAAGMASRVSPEQLKVWVKVELAEPNR